MELQWCLVEVHVMMIESGIEAELMEVKVARTQTLAVGKAEIAVIGAPEFEEAAEIQPQATLRC
jgi:hypothetical protein